MSRAGWRRSHDVDACLGFVSLLIVYICINKRLNRGCV